VGWRRRRQHEAELAAVHAESARLQTEVLRTELGDVHRDVARRDVELLRALFEVAAVNTELRRQLETEAANRANLTRAIDRLAMFIAAPAITAPIDVALQPPAPADLGAGSIIGGTINPGTINPGTINPGTINPGTINLSVAAADVATDGSGETTIDLTADTTPELPIAPATRAERPLACEVHLQFGDRWINGFQIEESIRVGDVTQFRLRRQVDGWVLPELFDETEVRVFMQPVVDGS
jgi:hypothetical protein